MEVSVIGSSQAKISTTALPCREFKFCLPSDAISCKTRQRQSFSGQGTKWRKFSLSSTARDVTSQAVPADKVLVRKSTSRCKSRENVRLFVGLPLDTVSDGNTINHARALAAGLKALKLLGVEGVEMPLWWGIVEKEAVGKYDWFGYLAVMDMVKKAGLKVHVSLCLHASRQPKIPLPDWVTRIGEAQPDIYFKDRSGKQYKDCLSFAVDNRPVLDGKSPIQVYHDFCKSFKSSFSDYMGSTITGISMGLGPDGELRYPSHHGLPNTKKIPGVGEFQCFDKYMLGSLKTFAEASGNPLWGLGGPHDAPSYDESPYSNTFFKDGGSWESPYGDFFLSWYSSQLISHGMHMLSLASSSFIDMGVAVYGKLPLVHSWFKIRSHPSELTAGFYNTNTREGYDPVAEMFAKNSCKMIIPGMDLSDEHQVVESQSSPESLLAQIKTSCKKHGVEVSGQNSVVSGVSGGFMTIKRHLLDENVGVDLFTYQRMGAYFFSPEHFPAFTEFVRSLNQLELHADDLPMEKEEPRESSHVTSASSATMQMT